MTYKKLGIVIMGISLLVISGVSGCILGGGNDHPTIDSMTASPQSGTAPLTVHFTATASDPDGSIASYHWDFGDGTTSNKQNPTHEFSSVGYYNVILTVTDDDGAITTHSIGINVVSKPPNNPPTCSLSANPTSGKAPLIVTFSMSASDTDGSIASWQLDINNDGSAEYSGSGNPPSTEQYTYQNLGTYTAKLTVTDNDGAKYSETKTITVIPNQPPSVSVSATPISGIEPLEVSFTATASDPDGSIASYHWDFGDGNTSLSSNPTHIFRATGLLETEHFEVTLTVTDNNGATATDTITITVLLDTDGDGIPDIDDIDDDNDGYLDTQDYLPKQDAKIKITLEKFKVVDEVDSSPNNLNAQVYFKIYINDDYKARASPQNNSFWNVDIGELKTINWVYIYNCPDDKNINKINIRMYDKDNIVDDLLDIDGHDNSNGLTVEYNIVTGTWTGDNTTGETDGSNDGTQHTDDDDAYLKYNIETM